MSLRSDLHISLRESVALIPGSSNNRVVQFRSEEGGRQYAVLCSEFEEYFAEEMALIAKSQTVDKTVRAGMMAWWHSTNPEYVKAVNAALEKVSLLLDSGDLGKMDTKVRQLFLARALQWTDEIKVANQLNSITDFNNRPLEALQSKLVRAGASKEYFNVLNFFQGLSQIAFADGGPLFRYPSFHLVESKATDSNGILMREGGEWLLVPPRKGPDQKAVFDALCPIVESFKDESKNGIPATITEQELLYGMALIGQVMTNYLSQIDDAPAVSHQVFTKLAELHDLMYELLCKKSSDGLSLTYNTKGKSELLDTFGILSNVLANEKFSGFYSNPEGSELLEEVQPFIRPFITFHLTPELLASKHKWVTIGSDQASGVNLYKTPEGEVVVIFNGNNEFWDRKRFNAFAFVGGRGTEFELDGMVHQQSIDNAAKARLGLMKIMQARKEEIGEFSKIKFIGYGLDGATAQLLGHEYKRNTSEKDVTVIGCGIPPFLDETASASMGIAMKKMSGFKCLNFTMAGDPNIRNLGITGPLGMRYDNTAFTTFPVPQGVIFASEAVSGDSRKAYLQMLNMSVFMHQTMRVVYERTEKAYGLVEKVKPISERVTAIPQTTVPQIGEGQNVVIVEDVDGEDSSQ